MRSAPPADPRLFEVATLNQRQLQTPDQLDATLKLVNQWLESGRTIAAYLPVDMAVKATNAELKRDDLNRWREKAAYPVQRHLLAAFDGEPPERHRMYDSIKGGKNGGWVDVILMGIYDGSIVTPSPAKAGPNSGW